MNVSAIQRLLANQQPPAWWDDSHSAQSEFGGDMAIECETGLFLYGFVRRINPTIIVETGTHAGYSAAWLALGLQDSAADIVYGNRKHLYSIDNVDHDGKAQALWEKLGLLDYITSIIADSRTLQLPHGLPVDFLWLDADHSENSIKQEFQNFLPFLASRTAWIGLHDTYIDGRVRKAIRDILEDGIWKDRYQHGNHIHMRNMRGLDLIQFTQIGAENDC